jgi:hypothetical protein
MTTSSDSLLDGFLERKEGRLLKSWVRRYYRLYPTPCLKEMDDMFSGMQKAEYPLDQLTSVMQKVNDKRQLIVRSGKQLIELRAESADAAKKWVETLQQFVSSTQSTEKRVDTKMLEPVSFDSGDTLFTGRDKSQVTQQGYMWKRAINSGRNWKRRFFILYPDDGRLAYYEDEASASGMKNPKGNVMLAHDAVVQEVKGKVANAFVIKVPSQSMQLFVGAESNESRQEWMGAINQSIETQLQQKLTQDGLTVHEAKRTVTRRRRTSLCDINGFLLKRAVKSGNNWKKRFFQLEGEKGVLKYYTNEYKAGNDDKKPKGVVVLTADTQILTGEEAQKLSKTRKLSLKSITAEAGKTKGGDDDEEEEPFDRALWECGRNVDKVLVILTPTKKLYIKGLVSTEEMIPWAAALRSSIRRRKVRSGEVIEADEEARLAAGAGADVGAGGGGGQKTVQPQRGGWAILPREDVVEYDEDEDGGEEDIDVGEEVDEAAIQELRHLSASAADGANSPGPSKGASEKGEPDAGAAAVKALFGGMRVGRTVATTSQQPHQAPSAVAAGTNCL